MKNLLILTVLLSVMAIAACGQKENVPTKVKSAFEQKFPNAKKVDWDKENTNEWEVEFKMNNVHYSANFDNDGIWKETEYKIKKSDIPSSVKSTLDNQFGDYDIEEVEISETSNGKVYELALEKDENDIEVAIAPNGKVVKKVVKEDNDEDND